MGEKLLLVPEIGERPIREGCPKPDAGPPGIRIYQRQDVRMSEASLYKKKIFFVTMDGDGW